MNVTQSRASTLLEHALGTDSAGRFETIAYETALHQKTQKHIWESLWQEILLAQRRKGAKKFLRNAAALCGFAPLRETIFPDVASDKLFTKNSATLSIRCPLVRLTSEEPKSNGK